MDKSDLTHSYLASLSSADLLTLADDCGLDIPENLARNFIITEILDSVAEKHTSQPLSANASENSEIKEVPLSYNENTVVAVLRDPIWCYVFWDFHERTFSDITSNHAFSGFVLRTSYYDNGNYKKAAKTFDIQVNKTDREQFILPDIHYASFCVSLVARFKSTEENTVASSAIITKPKKYPQVNLLRLQQDFSLIQNLSGLPDILAEHYNDYRHSFERN
ncbi:MAG: DUF4912 domain-containing protein [Spirochaetales bacterium]